MSLLNRLLLKAVTDARKWLGSSTRVISGDSQRPSFSNGESIKHYSSWIYAAANLNAYAVASQPLRLYVRNRSAGTKLWNTRRTDRRAKSYLSGSLEQLPSRYAMTKAAEYGDDYEVVTDNHPVLDLLSKANPWQNGFEQTVLRVLYLELTGNAYLHPVLDRRLGIPVELWTMPSQWVEIVPGKEEFVDGYLYGVSYEKRAFFERDEVIHFKRPNPRDIYYGMGKVEAAWMAATNNQSLHDMDYHWFANKARPDWLLTVKGDASQEEIDRLEAQIDSKLRGTRRTGRFLTATADIDIKPLSFSPKDMMGREQIVEEIAAVFGVPVSMLKANDPNLASATVGFTSWKATSVLPLMRMDEEVLNQTLLPLFGIEDDAFLAYDNPVAADEKFETEKRRAYAAGGILTVNEVREMEGLEAVSDPAASRLLINGQPLGGQPPQPAASPFAGLFGASAQPRQDAALTFGTATDTKTEPVVREVVESTETKAAERKDALGDCVSAKIPKLLDEGYEQDQAVAIAYSMCAERKSLDQVIADRRAAKKSCGCGCAKTKARVSHKALWSDILTKASERDAEREFEAMTEDEQKIARGVAGVFDRQIKDLIRRLEAHGGAPTAALVTEVEQALRSRKWNKELAGVLRPYIQQALENGVTLGLDTVAKVATTANFDVEKADLRAYAQSESVRLASRAADSVNRYTEVRVADMLGNGIAEGETIPELANRVRAWSEEDGDGTANGRRAVTIARTEANRATRVAEVEAWKATGAVEGKTWLLAPDPCEFCEAVAAQFNEKGVGLNDAFLTKDSTLTGADGGTMVLDYEDIQGAPLHPNCRCSLQPVLRSDLEEILGGMEADIEEEARKINLAEGNA